MATKFSDLGKGAKDLLNDDYTTANSLKCKKSAGPVNVTIDSDRNTSSGAVSSKIGAKFAYAGFNIDKLQLKANGARVFESSFKVAPELKLAFKADKGADLCVDYVKGPLFATGKLDAMKMSKINATACYSHKALGAKVGCNVVYGVDAKALSAYDFGASYVTGPLTASATTASKLSSLNLSVLYKANSDVTIASQTAHSNGKPLDLINIGASYKAPFGLVKAKYSGSGDIAACIVKEVAPKVKVTASGSVSTSDFSKFKTGLGIEM